MLRLNRKGFTLVEIMIVVAIIGLLAVIAIPNFIKARETAQLNTCYNNMRLIDAAIEQWALEYKQASGATVTESEMGEYIRGGIPSCPVSTATYTIPAVRGTVTCSEHGDLPTGY